MCSYTCSAADSFQSTFVSQVKTNCNNTVTNTFGGVAVRRRSNFVQVTNRNGVSVSCDLLLEVCSFTTDGWLHGK